MFLQELAFHYIVSSLPSYNWITRERMLSFVDVLYFDSFAIFVWCENGGRWLLGESFNVLFSFLFFISCLTLAYLPLSFLRFFFLFFPFLQLFIFIFIFIFGLICLFLLLPSCSTHWYSLSYSGGQRWSSYRWDYLHIQRPQVWGQNRDRQASGWNV